MRGAATATGKCHSQFGLLARLALRDYVHEWVMSGCFILALGAVLVPLLVLFGLKYGVISNLLDPLTQDPKYREIRPAGAGSYDSAWFERMREHTDVAFVVPRTRTIAATIRVRHPDSTQGRIIDVELIPSKHGDPVLPSILPAPEGFRKVLVSSTVAEKLGLSANTRLEGIISRIRDDEQETVILPLDIEAIAPPAAFSRDGLFVSVPLLAAIEDFRDGRAVPALAWEGDAPRSASRSFAGFRMYTRTIEGVIGMRKQLLSLGIDVRTRAGDIELVRTLDRNLGITFWIIALIAISGYCFSLGTSIWANVDRKQRDFSMLRLIGFRTGAIVWFPIIQALLTGFFGWLLACGVYYLVAALLNTLFVTGIGAGQPVCRLAPAHLGVTFVLTFLVAIVPAIAGGIRVAQMETSRGIRGE